MNSTAAIAELSSTFESGAAIQQLVTVNLLTIVAMFIRNLGLLLIFSPAAGFIAAVPIGLMALSATIVIWRLRHASSSSAGLAIGSPVSLRKLLSFGAIFIAIQVTSSLGQRLFGGSGAVIVSALGGLASSASATAAVAAISRHGQISSSTAALSTILASIASTLVNVPIVYRATRDRKVVRNLFLTSLLIVVLGLIALLVLDVLRDRLKRPV